jgi:hypothetical protein
MKKIIITLAITLGLWSFPALAGEGPEVFLSSLIASDFAGDCEPRFDKIHYTDGIMFLGDCDCKERREIFDTDASPLFIISSWQIVKTKMESKNKALITVRYRVIAKAKRITVERENDVRRIIPYDPPRDEEITYRVWRRKGQWMWVDPPEMPRVGYEAVRNSIRKRIEHYEDDLLKEYPDRDDWRRQLAFYKTELAALEALRPIIEADAGR